MIVGGYFLGVPLMVLMAGPAFAISGEIIKILLIATGVIFISGLFGYSIVALGLQKKMIKFYALDAVISVAGYLIFIPLYSYWGAAWMTVFAETFILLATVYVLHHHLKFTPKFNIAFKSLLASAIMALGLYIFPGLNFISALIVGTLIYLVALYLFKGVDREMILELAKNKKDEANNN